MTARTTALLLAGLLSTLSTCADEPTRPIPEGPDILFVLIDTLRTERMGVYGNDRPTTPFLDGLAADGLRFEHVIAQSPWTGASMASLWTSLIPAATGVGVVPGDDGVRSLDTGGVSRMHDDAVTLAEVLYERGYETLAVCTNPHASDRYGLLRGFSHKRTPFAADARAVVDHAVDLLTEADSRRPRFLYVHFMDVHEPTKPVPPYDTIFPTIDGEPHFEFHYKWGFIDGENLDSEKFARYESHKLALYDGALRFIDDEVGRLHAHLETQHPGATVTVLAADHGEEFWDHVDFERTHRIDPRGFFGIGHGHTMFPELLRMPLILHGPGTDRGVEPGLVRNLDIAPTVLGIVGADSAGMAGLDLLAARRNGGIPPLLAFSEDIAYGPEAKSLQSRDYQFLTWSDAEGRPTAFLFDKNAAAPQDAVDVQDSVPEVAAELRQQLELLLAGVEAEKRTAAELDDEAREALRSLGYVR